MHVYGLLSTVFPEYSIIFADNNICYSSNYLKVNKEYESKLLAMYIIILCSNCSYIGHILCVLLTINYQFIIQVMDGYIWIYTSESL